MIPTIQVERLENILRVTFDNPTRRNAIGTEALNGLGRLADEIAGDRTIRAVILTGAGGRAFTSGFDLNELADFEPEHFMRSHFSDVIEKWAKLPVPVIGRIRKGEFLLDCRCLEDVDEFSAQLIRLDIGA